jgi:hypothetical protein
VSFVFLSFEYLSTLNKIKNNKEQSEKFGHRLIHNVMLAEMFNNKMSNLANYIAKMGKRIIIFVPNFSLEDIIPELKAKSASKGKGILLSRTIYLLFRFQKSFFNIR